MREFSISGTVDSGVYPPQPPKPDVDLSNPASVRRSVTNLADQVRSGEYGQHTLGMILTTLSVLILAVEHLQGDDDA